MTGAKRCLKTGPRYRDEARALGPLLTNLNLVHESVGMVADESIYAGSSLAEFRNRMKTFGATVQTFRNRMNALSIALGETLFPALTIRAGPSFRISEVWKRASFASCCDIVRGSRW